MSKKGKDDDIKEQLNEINDSLEEIKFNLVQLLGSSPKQETKAKFDITPIRELIDPIAAEMAQENTVIEILEKIEKVGSPTQETSSVPSTETMEEIKETLQALANRSDVQTPDISSISEKLEGFSGMMERIFATLDKYPGQEIITEIREGIKKATGFEEAEKIAATVDDNLSKLNETLQEMDSRLSRLDEFGEFTASLPEILEQLQNDIRLLLEIDRDDQMHREEKARIEIERAADLLQTGVAMMDMQPTVEEIRSFVAESIQEKEALVKSREEILQLLKGVYEEIAKMKEDIHELRAVESTLSTVKKFFDAMIAETDAYKEWESKEEGNQQ